MMIIAPKQTSFLFPASCGADAPPGSQRTALNLESLSGGGNIYLGMEELHTWDMAPE